MSGTPLGRLATTTDRLRQEGIKPLVPFLTSGYPDERTFALILETMAQAGCSIVEIGFPFSDPVADGPIIQASSQKVLKAGMTLSRTLELAGIAHRQHGLSIVLMGYLNPILKMGAHRFALSCAREKIAGVIVPDLPPEEAGSFRDLLARGGTDLVDLIAPTTETARLSDNVTYSRGFLYLVSTTGVTGSTSSTEDGLVAYVTRVRQCTNMPLYVGFGISTPQQAAEVAAIADGAVVGSALIRLIDEAYEKSPAEAVARAAQYITTMVQAMGPEKGSAQ